LVTVFSASFVSWSQRRNTRIQASFVPSEVLGSSTIIHAEIFVNFLLGSERTRARSQTTSIEVEILSIITSVIAEIFAAVCLGGQRSVTGSKTTTVPIEESCGCARLVTEQFIFFNSNLKRESTSIHTSLIIVKIFAIWASVIAVINGVSHCGGKRSRTSGQARTVPIQVPACGTRIVTEVSVDGFSVFVRSITTISTSSIKVKGLIFSALVSTEIFTTS